MQPSFLITVTKCGILYLLMQFIFADDLFAIQKIECFLMLYNFE